MPKMTFVSPDGQTRKEVEAPLGLSVLEIAHRHGIDLEGACEGSLACSTCHVIVDPEWYEELDPATEEEEDMLDLAFGLTHTSRLGCQIPDVGCARRPHRHPAVGDPQHDVGGLRAAEAGTRQRRPCARGPSAATAS